MAACESFMFAACSGACVRVWSGEGKAVRLLRGHEDSITAMEGIDTSTSGGIGSASGTSTGTSGGGMIATGSVDRTVRVWDARAKKAQVFAFRGHGDTVLALRWGEGGRSLISSGKDKTVRIWDTRAGRLRATLEKHFGAVSCIRVLNNTSTTAVNSGSANAYVSSIGSSAVSSTSSVDNTCIVSAGRDSMLNVWSSNGDCIHSQAAHRCSVGFLSEINYGSVYGAGLSSSIGGGMGGYTNAYNATLHTTPYANTPTYYNAPFCTNPLMISIGTDSTIKLHDMRRFKCVSEINPLIGGVQSGVFTKAVWCHEGFIASSSSGVVRLYEYGSGDSASISGKDSHGNVSNTDTVDGAEYSGSHSPGTVPYPPNIANTNTVHNGMSNASQEWTYRDIGVHTTNASGSAKDNPSGAGGGTSGGSMSACTDLLCNESVCASAAKSGQVLRWVK